MKNIELEYRAELSLKRIESLKKELHHSLTSSDKRLTIMFYGKVNNKSIDIRVRIDSNQRAELVLKSGSHHAQDRVERSCNITKKQIIPLVSILDSLGLNSKVTERENHRYQLENNTQIALVSAKNIHYIEIERMSDKSSKDKDSSDLLSILAKHKIKPINKVEFDDLCTRLSEQSDWVFDGGDTHMKKLQTLLKKYS